MTLTSRGSAPARRSKLPLLMELLKFAPGSAGRIYGLGPLLEHSWWIWHSQAVNTGDIVQPTHGPALFKTRGLAVTSFPGATQVLVANLGRSNAFTRSKSPFDCVFCAAAAAAAMGPLSSPSIPKDRVRPTDDRPTDRCSGFAGFAVDFTRS